MKNCVYYVKSLNEEKTYSELLEWVSQLEGIDNELMSFDDIVFSKATRQDIIYEQLKAKNKEYGVQRREKSKTQGIIDGDVDITDSDSFALNEFLEHPLCKVGQGETTRSIVTHKNDEEYEKNFIESFLAKNKSATENDALQAWNELQQLNDIIVEDATALHSVLTSKLIHSSNTSAQIDFTRDYDKAATSRLKSSFLSDNLFKDLKESWMKTVGDFPNRKTISNLNLKSKLEGISKSIIGHIDHLIIDQDGTLHLYNFKVSSQKPGEWASAKVEKYKAQLVFLKHILAENGINVEDINLNIIPIHIQYSDDRTRVKSISVLGAKKYSGRSTDGTYSLETYDKMVSQLLKDNYTPIEIDNDSIKKANEDVQKFFPDLNIVDSGIAKTAEQWVQSAPDSDPYNIEPIVIEDVHHPGHGYNLIIRKKDRSTEVIKITSDKSKSKNKELLDKVKEYQKYLYDNNSYLLKTIKALVKEGYSKGTTEVFADAKGINSMFLETMFSKYLMYDEDPDTKAKNFRWKLRDDLSEANVLIFENEKTHQLDVVSLSPFHLNASPNLKKGSSILGYYRYDVETSLFKGDFGNIYLMRALALLNRLAPTLGNGVKLGMVQVINTQSSTQRSYSASYLNKSQFSELLRVVNSEHPDSIIENNLKKCRFADEVTALIDEYLNITDGMSDQAKEIYDSLGLEDLRQAPSEQREQKLFNIISSIYDIRPEFRDANVIQKLINSGSNSTNSKYARLLVLATAAYQAVRNEQVVHKTFLSSLETLSYTALNVPDDNIRIVTENLQIANDTISQEFMDQFYGIDKDGVVTSKKSMNQIFEDYFNEVGYSQAQGMTLGNEAQQFSNLYEKDDEGNNLMIFKNPYIKLNDDRYLNSAERKLLKHVLFAINSITNKNNFNYTSIDSPELIKYAKENEQYFWVPLERASKATRRQSWKAIKSAMKHMFKLITNSKERFEESVEGLMQEEAIVFEEGFDHLQLENSFASSMPVYNKYTKNRKQLSKSYASTLQRRRKMLKEHGPEYFETNLKNIFIDYLFKSIATEQYNKLLVSTKSLLLQLQLTSNYGGNLEAVQKELEYIQDYLKVNVFQRSIMEDKSKKVLSVVAPIKSAVSNLLLMGNVTSAMRDSIQGVLENMTRSLIKLNTNITPKTVSQAYWYLTTHSTSNARATNLLSKLCLRYRLSNTDVSRISERAKSARNGITNWDNWGYATLRGPDFLNRMTLFVARCMQDGCWDAWSLNSEGELEYEWRKDKRFDKLASGDINSPEYDSQRALYISKLREYNEEHPDMEPLDLSLETNLPSPYSNKDILSIRSLADNIYGSYDKSKKSMYENWALGVAMGMYTTWFNGIYNNYFGKAGQYATNKLEKVQDVDPETGQPLFLDKDNNIVTEAVGKDGTPNQKIWKWQPIVTQGIFPTLHTLYKVFKNDGKDGVFKYLKDNQGEKANILKLINDLIASALFFILFKAVLDGVYKDHKKEAKNKPLIQNLVTELIYKSSSRSYDSFLGPINIIQQLGDNMNPPYYSVPIKLLKDAYSTVFGEKQFAAMMADNFGFVRSYSDTIRAELKK